VEKRANKGNKQRVAYQSDEEDEEGRELSVRLDFFCQYVLDKAASLFISEMEKVYSHIKLSLTDSNQSNIPFDLYKEAIEIAGIDRSIRWIHHTYDMMMDRDISHGPPLVHTLCKIIPYYFVSQVPEVKPKPGEDDGYPLFQDFTNRPNIDRKEFHKNLERQIDIECYHSYMKSTLEFMKSGLTQHQKLAGNLDYYIDLLDKDLNNIKNIIRTLKKANKLGELYKTKTNLDLNWKRLRNVIKGRLTIPPNGNL